MLPPCIGHVVDMVRRINQKTNDVALFCSFSKEEGEKLP